MLENMHVTSQRAESEIEAWFRNHLRYVESQKMIYKALLCQRSSFLMRQEKAFAHSGPIPPSIDQHVAEH